MQVIDDIGKLEALVGIEVGVSDWVEITQSHIDDFADATRDRQWIHVDVARAKTESPFGSTVAHGFLTLSLLSHFASQVLTPGGNLRMGVNYGFNRVRFPSPVVVGSRVRARFVLQSLEAVCNGVQVTWAVTVEIKSADKPALVAEWIVRYYGSVPVGPCAR